MPKARLIALYLPQFHPIPENDEWWGKGFTEWTNVAKAKPLFVGHQQPNLPGDLGYYDLRVPESREAQAELAREHGIEGFCYWHYWFGGGRRLLERPFHEVLQSGKPDFPFCLAWANHTWSGVWHGCPDRILIEQTYPGVEDHTAHFYAMLDAFRDPRYLKVDGKCIFSIYKPKDLKEPRLFMDTWRELAEKEGLGGFHFIAMVDFPWDPLDDDGYDAYTTNPPVAMVTKQDVRPLNEEIERETLKWRYFSKEKPQLPQVYSYESFVAQAFPDKVRCPDFYPAVVPNWDNTPRSGTNGFVLHDSTPELYEGHLSEAVELVADRAADRRVIFVKSWNEWAETNYLEPDLRWGKAYLEATRRAVDYQGDGRLKVHFINVRTLHHSPHSGYDRFLDHVPNELLPVAQSYHDFSEQRREELFREAKEWVSWYNPADLERESAVNELVPTGSRHVCHYLYGENSLYHTARSASPLKKIFVSFHQPPEAHQEFVRSRDPLANVDGIIVVGTNQIPFFTQYVDPRKIHFVPHGVDTDFFKPDAAITKDPNKILFVGNWLRDFDTLVKVSEILAARAPNVSIDVVTLEKNRHLLDDCNNIVIHSGIPEEDLLRKYQGASLLLIPMKDCTANNSVLEGMACGLPVVTTDIGGIRDYVDDKCGILCRPGDAEEMAAAILQLLSSPPTRLAMGRASRERSLDFGWEKVAEQLRAAYASAFRPAVDGIESVVLPENSSTLQETAFSAPVATSDIDLFKSNKELQQHEYDQKKTVLESFPTILNLPVADQCNLRCSMCSWSEGDDYYNIKITPQSYDKVKQVFPYLKTLELEGAEVFTAKEGTGHLVDEIIAESEKYPNLLLAALTNGQLINDKRAQKIVSKFGVLNVSIDTPVASVYESIRIGGRFEILVNNMKNINRIKQSRGKGPKDSPRLQFSAIITDRTYRDLVQLAHLIAELGGVYFSFQPLRKSVSNDMWDSLKDEDIFHDRAKVVKYLNIVKEVNEVAPKLDITVLDRTKTYARALHPDLFVESGLGRPEENPPPPATKSGITTPVEQRTICRFPWRNFFIRPNGEVAFSCCSKVVIGNINENTIQEIYNSPAAIEERAKILSGNYENCNVNCQMGYSFAGTNLAKP